MLIQRQYNILQSLVHEDRWFSMNELARKLNCSIKTVQRDIVYLQKKLPEKWLIKKIKTMVYDYTNLLIHLLIT